MKKFLAVFAVLALLTSGAFAGITSYTQESSMALYPGVLNPGSLTGANTFVTDIALFGNSALIEDLGGGDFLGLVSLKTDMGTFAVSASHTEYIYLDGIDPDYPSMVLGLAWAGDMNFGKLGVAVLYGVNSLYDENKNPALYASNSSDKYSKFYQYLGLKGTVGLTGLDLALNFGTINSGDATKNKNASGTIVGDSSTSYGNMRIGADARLALTKDLLVSAGLGFKNGGVNNITKTDANNDGDFTDAGDTNSVFTNSNNALDFSALIGKTIKATDTLSVLLSAGLLGNVTASDDKVTENKNTGVKTYETTTWNEFYCYVPVNIAIKGKLNETWTFSAGASFYAINFNNYVTKYSENPNTQKPSYKDNNIHTDINISPYLGYSIGLTGKIGDFRIDMYIDPEILMAGPNFISNYSDDLNNSIALVYEWK